MREDQECRSYVDHLVAEHRRLHLLLKQTRGVMAHSAGPDESPSFAGAQQALTRLRDELQRHFAQEEGGGCMDEAVSRCPRLAGDEQQIEAEHPQILAELDQLIVQSQTLSPTPGHQLLVQQAFERLCQRLCDHERDEDSLLAQGFGVALSGEESSHRPLILDV
jgi:hemerythrin